MVRLKDWYSTYTVTIFYISIPYGAIKSVIVESDVNETMSISIPYGAIKSWPRPQTIEVSIIISIPYGAIKSSNLLTSKKLPLLFQFLMVRLKA